MDRKLKVLFLSTGNSTRSQLAEGVLRSIAGDRFEAISAGIEPGDLNPSAVEAMRNVGIDISNQEPKNVIECLKEHFAYVITVSDIARERAPIFPSTPNLLHWSLEDPAVVEGSTEEKRISFFPVRDEIREKMEKFLDEIGANHPKETEPATH
jgi:arsenate reductase